MWATRIDNIVGDESLDAFGRAWRLALALSFVVLAVAAGVRWRRRTGPSGRPLVAVGLAWWTIGVWIIRGGGLALAEHEIAFIVVHLALAAVSIVLAAQVLRSLSDAPLSDGPQPPS